jgi:hypothetical protein
MSLKAVGVEAIAAILGRRRQPRKRNRWRVQVRTGIARAWGGCATHLHTLPIAHDAAAGAGPSQRYC